MTVCGGKSARGATAAARAWPLYRGAACQLAGGTGATAAAAGRPPRHAQSCGIDGETVGRGGPSAPQPRSGRKAVIAHVAPFLLWIFFILVFLVCDKLGSPLPRSWTAPAYALKSVICAALLLCFRPWRYYRPQLLTQTLSTQTLSNFVLGILAGLFVAVLWIFPEMPWTFIHAKGFASFYNNWFIMPVGAYPDYFRPDVFPALPPLHPSLAYAPEECGWTMTVAKLLGSAFVIAAAEELFFRGFLYRWLLKSDFLAIPLVKYDAQVFWTVVAVFGLEHDRWLAGMMAGAVYGWLVLRTGRLMPSVVAHAVTNLILGLYVIVSHQYGFW